MMELRMTTDLDTELPAVIEFNFDELKTELAERLDHYNGLIVTEDAIKEGKADRAKLAKLREAIETRRKQVKKQCMAPYNAFEARVKELVALIDAPILAIDTQLKQYEDLRREEKQQMIEEAYEGMVPGAFKRIIPLERIMNPKWLNATTSMKKVEEDLETIIKRTTADMMVIDTVEPEYRTAVYEEYIRNLDIVQAMAKKKALQEAAEAFRMRETEKANEILTEKPAPAQEAKPEPMRAAEPAVDEKLYALRLEFHVTMTQANALKRFLSENGIEYIKI